MFLLPTFDTPYVSLIITKFQFFMYVRDSFGWEIWEFSEQQFTEILVKKEPKGSNILSVKCLQRNEKLNVLLLLFDTEVKRWNFLHGDLLSSNGKEWLFIVDAWDFVLKAFVLVVVRLEESILKKDKSRWRTKHLSSELIVGVVYFGGWLFWWVCHRLWWTCAGRGA